MEDGTAHVTEGKTRIPMSAMRGMIVFVLLTFALAWLPALALDGTRLGEGRPLVTRLLASSIYYAATMGWQPLVAMWIVRTWFDPDERLDAGLRRSRARFILLAGAGAAALLVLAAVVAGVAGLLGAAVPQALYGNSEPELVARPPSAGLLIAFVAAFATALVLIWGQCISEEIGWRGYFLARLVEGIGTTRALVIHGMVWGLWYAPVLLLASGGTAGPVPPGALVVTCTLLGILLGWLRLRSRSVVPPAVANAVLTIGAGFPLLLHGGDAGLRAAVYGPAGWLPMLAAIALVLGSLRPRRDG